MDQDQDNIVSANNEFNPNGVELPEKQEFPNVSTGSVIGDAATGFAHGFNKGLNGVKNSKNNPALGQKKHGNGLDTPNSDNKLDDNNKLGDKNNNFPDKKGENTPNANPIPGAKNKKNDEKSKGSNKDGMPKASNSGNKTTPKKELGNDKSGGFNPRKKITDFASKGLSSLKSKLATGGSGEESNSNNGDNGGGLISNASQLLSIMPLSVKIMVGSGVLIFIALSVLFLVIIGVITGTVSTLSGCDSPSYAVNSADATEFLCNMQSPFKEDGYTVTSVSGWRICPIHGHEFHAGTDVVGNGGSSQKIYAVADGTVEIAGPYSGYGNAVKINHNGNFTTLYGHMSSISSEAKSALENKTTITAGTYIGIQGNTGDSKGVHLHFEVRDSNGKYVSANPFFGYSDQGYEECVNPDKSVSSSSACVKSDTPSARHIGQEGFNQICGRTPAYNTGASSSACCGASYSSSSSGSLLKFLGIFEGGTGSSYQCKTSSGQDGYLVYNHGDKNTVGPGVTTDYLPGITVGECIEKSKVEDGVNRAVDSKRKMIKSTFINANLSQHQEDAMTSMAYNGCGTYFTGIAKAAEKDNLSEVWAAMKGCITSDGEVLEGLRKRRKAEFALYVTGDYDVAESYKSKTWTSSEYDDYDSDGVIAKKTSGTSSNSCSPTSGSSSNAVINAAIKELDEWNGFSNDDQYCTAIKKYMNSCGLGETVDEYCAGFVTYVLKEANAFDSVGLPKTTCNVGNFKSPTTGKIYDSGGSYTPKPGDLFIKNDSSGNDYGHIGLVEKVEGKTVYTIEGNTNPFGDFCGKGSLRRKTHTFDDITHFISY